MQKTYVQKKITSLWEEKEGLPSFQQKSQTEDEKADEQVKPPSLREETEFSSKHKSQLLLITEQITG